MSKCLLRGNVKSLSKGLITKVSAGVRASRNSANFPNSPVLTRIGVIKDTFGYDAD